MTYDKNTTRDEAGDLVPPEQSQEIIKQTTQQSFVLSQFKRVPITTNQKEFPVLNALPIAYFVDPVDTGLAQTTQMAWKNIMMKVADIMVLAPIPANVVDDVASGNISLTDEMVPYLAEAAGVLVDGAMCFGTSKPTIWPTDLKTACVAAGNTYSRGTNPQNKGGIATDINELMRLMAKQGYRPNGMYARNTFEFDLDNARDTTGQKLLDVQNNSFRGRPIMYGGDGVFPEDTGGVGDLFAIDRSKFLCGVRKEMQIKFFTEGAISDNDGKVIYNLMQQDGIVARLKMRVGIAVAKPVTLLKQAEDGSDRYPAAMLLSPSEA